MGYNISRFSINRNLPQLDLLLEAECDVRWETENPRQLSYKLREALQSCKEFEGFTHYYDRITSNFTFREESNAVVATYNPVPVGVPVGEMDGGEDRRLGNQTKGTLETARTLIDVLGGGQEGDERGYEEIYFPNVVLNKKDMKALWDWTESNDWGFIDHQEKGLTLTKSLEFEGILWRPEG